MGRRGTHIHYWWKRKWNRPLGKPRCMWVDNIKMDLGDTGLGGVGWIDLAQDRSKWRALVHAVMNLQVPYNAGKLFGGCSHGSLQRVSL
jgi:hypothetical protein